MDDALYMTMGFVMGYAIAPIVVGLGFWIVDSAIRRFKRAA